MTSQQPQHAPVRLLIAESSENAAHEFDSLLRDAGISTRAEIIDLPMAADSMGEADILLANSSLPELKQLLPHLAAKAPHVPIILINPDDSNLSTTQGMQLGAADVVPKSEPEQLVLVVKRELDHVCQINRLSQTRRALKEAEQRCQLLLQGSKAAIAYVHEGMHIYANEGYLTLFGFDDAEDLLGLPLMDLLDGESATALKAALKGFRQDDEEQVLDFSGQSTKGDPVVGNMTLAAAEYEGEHCIQVTMRTEASEPKSVPASDLEDELAEGAKSNPEISNGSAPESPETVSDNDLPQFLTACTSLFEAAEDGSFSAIFAAEIDNFAQLQRDYGLAGGSEICCRVEQCLAEIVGDKPMTRLSNYQFGFAINSATRKSALDEVEALRGKVETLMFEVNEKTIRPSLSFGGAALETSDDQAGQAPNQTPNQTTEVCLDSAFATVQAAIENGNGNCVELLSLDIGEAGDGGLEGEAVRVLDLVNEAIENQRFVLLFQPIISLRGDSDEHYEVFLRMLDRQGKQMSPGEFLDTAIENNVAGKIDRWVILQSIKMLSSHRSKGHNTRLTINLTCNSVTDPEFLQWLGVAIKAARLPSDAVIFQITEKDASTYIRQTREFVEGLKQMHCRASLSRFGITADPFEVLSHIPAEFVKLDGDKVESMINDEDMRETITEMIRELQSSGKLTVVPMVESANVLSALWQAGANYIQGHYLQEPSTQMDYDFSTDD
jgi:EAL domain-containing protein (putative c-di-GMP-specific phosphodiesterase class I)/GGDEF domain-containing protein/PAS domain-containing protein